MKTPKKSTPRPIESGGDAPPVRSSALLSNGAAISAGLAIFLFVVARFCGDGFLFPVLAGVLRDGAITTIILTSALALGAIILRHLRCRRGGTFYFSTAVALGIGCISLATLGLGLCAALNRGSAIAMLGISLVFGVIDWRRDPERTALAKHFDQAARWLREPALWNWLWLAAAPFAAVAVCGASFMPGTLWKPLDPHPYDVLSYHLQVPRVWYEAGKITPLKSNVFSFFPFLVEMLFLLAMNLTGGPWAAMYLCQFICIAMTGTMVLGVSGTICEVSRIQKINASGAIGGLAAVAAPWVVMLGCVAYVESAMLMFCALATGWMLVAIVDPESRRREFITGGLLAGFACGTKYTCVPMILLALPIAAVGAVLIHRRDRSELKMIAGRCVLFVLAGLLTVSPWLVRNTIWTGNPVFPLGMKTLAQAHFSQQQAQRFEKAHAAPPNESGMWRRAQAVWQKNEADWQYGFVVLPCAIAATLLLIRRREGTFLGIAMLLISFIWAGFTHLIPRFFVGVIPPAAIVIALAARGKRRFVGAAIVLVAAAIGFFGPPGDSSDAFANGLQPLFEQFCDRFGRQGLFRLTDVRALEPDSVREVETTPFDLAMIGDAQPFLYQIPASRIEYRTVFDVNIPPGQNVIDGWLGQSVADLRRNHFVLINISELARLAGTPQHPGTYSGLPPLPEDLRTLPALRDAPAEMDLSHVEKVEKQTPQIMLRPYGY